MSSTYTAPIVHTDIKALAATWPPTPMSRAHKLRAAILTARSAPSPARAPATSSLVAISCTRRFADLIAALAGLGSEASRT